MPSENDSKVNIHFLLTEEKYRKTKEFSTFSTEFCTMHTLHSDGFMQNKGYIKPETRRNMQKASRRSKSLIAPEKPKKSAQNREIAAFGRVLLDGGGEGE